MKKKLISVLFILLITSLCLSSCSPINVLTVDTLPKDENSPPITQTAEEELCGLWIATAMNINYPSRPTLSSTQLKSELDSIVECAAGMGANAIFFQVRPSSDALYDSKIFPTSKYLTGTEGTAPSDGFDPLDYLISAAHSEGIAVHAWVNPLRAAIGVSDLSELSKEHPARLHPEYTVKYADGRYYYNAGLPEVRKLVADGVSEIAAGYDVDGIIFDDYFYPYPTQLAGKTAEFDDVAAFAAYGEEYVSVADFRRDSVNKMIRDCYTAIKTADPDCLFGVAPFGIWKNDDGINGGSGTSGLSSYHDIYCDTIAWAEGGYIDYLAPQIYWDFESERAPFAELCNWWNDALANSGVDYCISYAAYRYQDDWESPEGEMTDQVTLARQTENYRGGIFYGYEQIKNNIHGVKDELSALFSEKRLYTEGKSN